MIKYIRTIFFFLGILSLSAQNYPMKELMLGNHQHYSISPRGYHSLVYDFDRDKIHTIDTVQTISQMYGGTTQLNNRQGELLLYTDGAYLYYPNGEIIENGDSIKPEITNEPWHDYSRTPQGQLFIPVPENDSLFYLIHADNAFGVGRPTIVISIDSIFYSLISINKDVKISVLKKNQLLAAVGDGVDKMGATFTALRHGNGRDWWLIIPGIKAREFYYYLISPHGINFNHAQENPDSLESNIANCSFSQDGNSVIMTSRSGDYINDRENMKTTVQIYDFDRCNAHLQLRDSLSWKHKYGRSQGNAFFSESDRYIYLNTYRKIYQVENQSPTDLTDTVVAFQLPDKNKPFGEPNTFYDNLITYDGKIWISPYGVATGFWEFTNPESSVKEDEIIINEKYFPGEEFNNYLSFSHTALFTAGPLDGSDCDTLGLNNEVEALFRYHIPNKDTSFVRFWDVSFFEPTKWEWDFGDGNESEKEYPTHTYEYGGTYYVCLTVRNPYSEDTYCNDVTVVGDSMPVSIIEDDINSLKLFPNPVHDNILHLSNPQQLHGEYVVYNNEGKAIRKASIKGIPRQEIDISTLKSGVYFIQVNTELGTRNMKVVVL